MRTINSSSIFCVFLFFFTFPFCFCACTSDLKSLLAWQRAEQDPKLLPQPPPNYFSNKLVLSPSKADRATHKNTKTFIPSWLGNHSSRTTSLKTNNYDLDVDFHGHNHLHSSFLFMLSPSLSQISLSPISQFFFFLSSSQFLLILNQLHQEASVRGHVSCKFYLHSWEIMRQSRPQSSYLSQIPHIIFFGKKLSCRVLGKFGKCWEKFWEILGNF